MIIPRYDALCGRSNRAVKVGRYAQGPSQRPRIELNGSSCCGGHRQAFRGLCLNESTFRLSDHPNLSSTSQRFASTGTKLCVADVITRYWRQPWIARARLPKHCFPSPNFRGKLEQLASRLATWQGLVCARLSGEIDRDLLGKVHQPYKLNCDVLYGRCPWLSKRGPRSVQHRATLARGILVFLEKMRPHGQHNKDGTKRPTGALPPSSCCESSVHRCKNVTPPCPLFALVPMTEILQGKQWRLWRLQALSTAPSASTVD